MIAAELAHQLRDDEHAGATLTAEMPAFRPAVAHADAQATRGQPERVGPRVAGDTAPAIAADGSAQEGPAQEGPAQEGPAQESPE